MEDEQEKPIVKPVVRTEPVEAPGGAAQVYSNHYQISWTAWDVQIRLSHLHRLPDADPTNRLEHRATITMAWPEVKAMVMELGSILLNYEKKNGELKMPQLP